MSDSDRVQLEIGPVPTTRQERALELLSGRLPEKVDFSRIRSMLDAASTGTISLDGLLEARRGQQLVGVAWFFLLPGRTAGVCPAELVPGEPESTAVQLQTAVNSRLLGGGVRLAHALLPCTDMVGRDRLLANGFSHAIDRLYMVSYQDQFPRQKPLGVLGYEPYRPASPQRLEQIVESTYQGTLDCVQLDRVREVRDVIAGHRATGVFAPEMWFILRHDGRDVGCLLLADHPEDGQRELVYMGLISQARGNGWGLEATRHAQWLTRQAGRAQLVLAVDAGNHPAIHVYQAADFSTWDRQSVYLKLFEVAQPG